MGLPLLEVRINSAAPRLHEFSPPVPAGTARLGLDRRATTASGPKRLIANQPLLSLVDQDICDDGRACWPQLATCCVIPGREFLNFLSARCGSKQRPQFLRSFLEVSLRSHRSSLSTERGSFIWSGMRLPTRGHLPIETDNLSVGECLLRSANFVISSICESDECPWHSRWLDRLVPWTPRWQIRILPQISLLHAAAVAI